MKAAFIFLLSSCVLLGGFFWLTQEDECYGYRGITVTHRLVSEKVIDKFKITVYLPKSYNEDDSRRYPVIYQLDGDYYGKTMAILMSHMQCKGELPTEAIVVSVGYYYDTWVDKRYRDFIYTAKISHETLNVLAQMGGGMKFYEFFKFELIPYVDTHFKTDNSMYGRTLAGHHMGGYFALLVMFRQIADQHKAEKGFSNFIAASPVIVNSWEFFFPVESYIRKHYRGRLPIRLYMGSSTQEERTPVKYIPVLAYQLKKWKFPGFRFKHDILEKIRETKTAVPVFTEGLRFIYKD